MRVTHTAAVVHDNLATIGRRLRVYERYVARQSQRLRVLPESAQDKRTLAVMFALGERSRGVSEALVNLLIGFPATFTQQDLAEVQQFGTTANKLSVEDLRLRIRSERLARQVGFKVCVVQQPNRNLRGSVNGVNGSSLAI